MSYDYTRGVSAELEIQDDGALALRFCDAQVGQWGEPLGNLAEWNDHDLAEEIANEIEGQAHDLAESLVRDLRERMRAGTRKEQER